MDFEARGAAAPSPTLSPPQPTPMDRVMSPPSPTASPAFCYCTSSDNAPQHFHNVKLFNYLSRVPKRFPWVRRVTWSFGCPGHGKGAWDGVAGWLKREVRRAILNEQIRTPSKRIFDAKDVYEHLVRMVGGLSSYAKEHVNATINRVEVHFVPRGEIPRPAAENPDQFESWAGISTCRQILAVDDDCVASRAYSCWCQKCLRAFGRGKGTMDSNLRVAGCQGPAWVEHHIPKVSAAGVRANMAEEKRHGIAYAQGLVAGSVVAVQPGADADDVYWLAVASRAAWPETHEWYGTPLLERIEEQRATRAGTTYTRDEYVLSVRYLERVESDDERRTFFFPKNTVIHTVNSSRIRAVDLELAEVHGAVPDVAAPPRPAARRRRAAEPPVPMPFVHELVRRGARIAVAQDNPKKGMSGERYARYRAATTTTEFRDLGGTRGDLQHDLRKGFVTGVGWELATELSMFANETVPVRADPAAATETEIDRTFDPVDDTNYTTNRCYLLSSSAETTILGACHDH